MTRRQSIALLGAGMCAASARSLKDSWQQIASEIDGTVGAAALHLGSGHMVSLNADDRFPLASVCKLPIAMNIFAMVDEGKLSLDQLVEIPLYDVVPGASPIAERWPKQKRFPLEEMVELMVAKSDNTAVQTLFRMSGGADGMADRFRQWKVTGIRLDRSERQCGLDAAGVRDVPPVSRWTPGMAEELTARVPPDERLAAFRRFLNDPRDTGTPNGTLQLLKRTFAGELLSKPSTIRLVKILENTTTWPGRIKGLLPSGTVVAHKTGTTETVNGLNGATNDVGVITLPNGNGRLAIAVYVKGSTRDVAAREKVIARIARTAFDSLT